jgi:stage II sporulation protein AA (anti-sigma F factor antagonist)
VERKKKMQDVVAFAYDDGALTARLTCEIDHHTARQIREKIDGEIFAHRPPLIYLDFSEVHFMDSSGIALIIGRVEVSRAVSATVRVTGLSPTLRRLVRLSGLEKIRELVISA